MKKVSIHKKIADQVIEAMKTSGNNWIQSWAVPSHQQPTSVVTDKEYTGVNWLILSLAKFDQNFTTGKWATYRGWQKLGAQVKKGSKGHQIIYFSTVKIDDQNSEESKTIPYAKPYTVFNADQVEGYDLPEVDTMFHDMPDTVADDLANKIGVKIVNDNKAQALYIPSKDIINMPMQSQFKDPESYAATLLHEMVHWTSHKDRCDRNIKNKHGTKDYAFEELIAELGSAMLCGSLNISARPREEHAKYLNSWIAKLSENPKAIFSASAKAQKAVNFILDRRNENND
jgi:antirestriction protein ArdC